MYWHDNVVASAQMLDAVVEAGVRTVIFSSTAAVYGTPDRVPIEEHQYPRPHNAYGATKRAVEMLLADYARAGLLSYAALRYFNAAGANVDAGLGERHDPETHLIPLAIEAARGTLPQLEVYGDDWPTPDGTCVRDYIHVCDLADAHLAALTHLRNGGESGAFNLGTGHGYSVREVISAVERVSGKTVPAVMRPRRPGDPATLVASPAKAEAAWGWKARRSSLDQILRDAWSWHEVRGKHL
jgi:UDP-glucose-4-epimerase GalE